MPIFAVIRSHQEKWQHSLPLEQQKQWREHADFMDALVAEGFIILGGPLEGTSDVLLIARAESEEEIEQRLAADPWTSSGLLRTLRVARWTLRLGSLA